MDCMGTNTAGLITTSARYELALASGTTVTVWRELARVFDRDADGAWTLGQRQKWRDRADDCRSRAARLERQAVAA